MQRLRITFSRNDELKYISHLDLMRLWERALRRADIPLAYSQGFSPHPKISIAAPLALGVTSEHELMDISLKRRMPPYFFIKTVSPKLPQGIDIGGVEEVSPWLPSLQSQVRYAEYRVEIEARASQAETEGTLRSFLSREHFPWQHTRVKEVRSYDLRALVDDLWVHDWQQPSTVLGMRLRTDSGGTGRPEQVTLALGFDEPPASIHRTRLILA
ncbi:TIGR03936 family radical SAM-associated protein [Chloroflexota bacterium]